MTRRIQFDSIKTRLLGPLVALLVWLVVTFGFMGWAFWSQSELLRGNLAVASEVSHHVLEVIRNRSRMQEILLLSRLHGDPVYANELAALASSRFETLDRIKAYADAVPALRYSSDSLVGGLKEAVYLQDQMVKATLAPNLTRADEAFRQLSTIFEINSARLKDLSLFLKADLAADSEAMRVLFLRSMVVLTLALAFVGLTVWAIAVVYRRSILRPLNELHGALQSLARGDMRSQVAVGPSPRELSEMMSDFNSMVGALGKTQSELVRARKEAEKAARIKSEFLSNMSHELRTPMNAIIGMADLLAEAELPPVHRKYLHVLQSSSDVLLNTVNDILDDARLEAGTIALEEVPFDVSALVTRVSEVIDVLTSKKRVRFVRRFEPVGPCWVRGDPKRLEQIVLNLLGNAVKFTEAGRIAFEGEATPRGGAVALRLRFSDTGIGIAAEQLAHVFERYKQSDNSITRKYGGTGLGLAIVKQLVEIMGGRMSVTSELGRGSEFLVELTLPAAAVGYAEDRPAVVARLGRVARTASFGRILVVDDAPDNRFLIHAYLKAARCEIVMAENGQVAVELFREQKFDLVLMDMQMPVMDGYQATACIRDIEAEQGRERTPIVALTAHAMKAEVEKTRSAGCDVHLTKPLGRGELLKAMAELIAP